MTRKHKCPNRFAMDGANGGCFFEIEAGEEERPEVRVGWSCVIVHDRPLPITWLSELGAIATAHKGGIAGFLKEHDYGGESYALMCDPPEEVKT